MCGENEKSWNTDFFIGWSLRGILYARDTCISRWNRTRGYMKWRIPIVVLFAYSFGLNKNLRRLSDGQVSDLAFPRKYCTRILRPRKDRSFAWLAPDPNQEPQFEVESTASSFSDCNHIVPCQLWEYHPVELKIWTIRLAWSQSWTRSICQN